MILLYLMYKGGSSGGGEGEQEKEGLRHSIPPHASLHHGIAGEIISGTIEMRKRKLRKSEEFTQDNLREARIEIRFV